MRSGWENSQGNGPLTTPYTRGAPGGGGTAKCAVRDRGELGRPRYPGARGLVIHGGTASTRASFRLEIDPVVLEFERDDRSIADSNARRSRSN